MDRRNFLKVIAGGLTLPFIGKDVVAHEVRPIREESAPPLVAHPGNATILMLPDSSLIYQENQRIVRFPDYMIFPLAVVHAPVLQLHVPESKKVHMTTRKTKLNITSELVDDLLAFNNEHHYSEVIVSEIMKELKEHNYKYFHSIILVPHITPSTFEMRFGVLVRGA